MSVAFDPVAHRRWYESQVAEAEARFMPLADALARETEMPWHVDQTGGMIFCLALNLPGQAWVWFSEWQHDFTEEGVGRPLMGLYSHWEDEGQYPEPPAELVADAGWTMADAIAKWAAPLILEFALLPRAARRAALHREPKP